MENLQFLGAAVVFFAVGIGMVLYEIARNKASRPILKGGNAIQLYYCGYLSLLCSWYRVRHRSHREMSH